MSKTVLDYTIQFSISTQFSSIWAIDKTLSGATTVGQSRPGSDGNKVTLCILQNSSIIGTSLSDCLVSYPRHSLGKSYLSVEMQSVYSTAPADWALRILLTKCVYKSYIYIFDIHVLTGLALNNL